MGKEEKGGEVLALYLFPSPLGFEFVLFLSLCLCLFFCLSLSVPLCACGNVSVSLWFSASQFPLCVCLSLFRWVSFGLPPPLLPAPSPLSLRTGRGLQRTAISPLRFPTPFPPQVFSLLLIQGR